MPSMPPAIPMRSAPVGRVGVCCCDPVIPPGLLHTVLGACSPHGEPAALGVSVHHDVQSTRDRAWHGLALDKRPLPLLGLLLRLGVKVGCVATLGPQAPGPLVTLGQPPLAGLGSAPTSRRVPAAGTS